MPKLPIISGRQAIAAFCKAGYKVNRQRGSHIRLTGAGMNPLTIPNHKVLGKGLLRKLLRDAQMSVGDFLELLKQ